MSGRPGGAALLRAALLPILALSAGCGSLARLNDHAVPLYEAGNFAAAADALSPLPPEGGKDRLLALYERGMMLHAARRFEASNTDLLEAGKLAEDVELIGLAERSGTWITNENAVDYRGEDWDRVLVHTLAALNYLGLNQTMEALVECRRMMEVHKKIRAVREKDDRINAFALYLSGLCYELDGQPNDAYVDYRACWELAPSFPPLADHLLGISRRLGMAQEHREWAEKFGHEDTPAPPGTGEVVLLLEAGRGPAKVPGGPLGILPALEHRPSTAAAGRLIVDGSPTETTTVLNDVESWARDTLKEREVLLLLKRAAILAAKEVAAEATRKAAKKEADKVEKDVEEKHGKTAGKVVGAVLDAVLDQTFVRLAVLWTEKPDLRAWGTLPQTFQACRIRVPAGAHDLSVLPVDAAGAPVSAPLLFPRAEVAEGKILVLVARVVR